MNIFFQKQFEEEFLRSERLRVRTLLGIIIVGITYATYNFIRLGGSASSDLKWSMMTIVYFLFGMALIELIMLVFVQKKISDGFRSIPLWIQYMTGAIEISSPTMLMSLLLNNGATPVAVLNSPIFNLYFVFIILSTLRLDFRISLFIAMLGAMEFFLLSKGIMLSSSIKTLEELNNSHVHYTSKSLVILLTGMGAAFVAGQIRSKINRSLIVAEKGNKLVNLFGQQVSKEIVEEMLQSDGELPSRLMRVCVMFIDIRNFTGYVKGKAPHEIVKYQNTFFAIIIDIVAKHGGIINQFLGDGCMITFGAPVPLKNHCEQAVRAALEIRETIEEHVRKSLLPETTIGIGIHVGDAVTGNIGTDMRQQYTITGSVVIIAARIEQLNKEFKSQILTSADVISEVNSMHLGTRHLGGVTLKGLTDPVGIYMLA